LDQRFCASKPNENSRRKSMEARTEFGGQGISKGLVAVVAVSITMALGVGAGVVAKNLSVGSAPRTHISQGLGGAAQENPARRGGVQIAGGSSAPATSPTPSRPVLTDARGHRWI
jgi:hypothetical protein